MTKPAYAPMTRCQRVDHWMNLPTYIGNQCANGQYTFANDERSVDGKDETAQTYSQISGNSRADVDKSRRLGSWTPMISPPVLPPQIGEYGWLILSNILLGLWACRPPGCMNRYGSEGPSESRSAHIEALLEDAIPLPHTSCTSETQVLLMN